jgi:hypothetical protein
MAAFFAAAAIIAFLALTEHAGGGRDLMPPFGSMNLRNSLACINKDGVNRWPAAL